MRAFSTLVVVTFLTTPSLNAQVVPATPAPNTPPRTAAVEEAIVLSPFAINATTDTGYAATSTLGGTRLKSELRDVASQIDVMTSEFLEDIGALTLDEAVRYSMNIESNEENFSPGTDPNSNVSDKPGTA
jgi:outer membrane receptor for ferric coprogen and ferric-rhodotorulic acid